MERFAHLALPSLGINPSLLLHESGASLQVLLNGWVLNGLEADLREIRFQTRCELLDATRARCTLLIKQRMCPRRMATKQPAQRLALEMSILPLLATGLRDLRAVLHEGMGGERLRERGSV